jgi:hypothetical protein
MRRLVGLFALVAVLAAGCIHGNSGKPVTLSPLQARRLAEAIVKNTPEYIHFEAGTKFDWVLTDWDSASTPPEVEKAVLRLLAKKYKKVYRHEAELPPEALVMHEGQLAGYQGGFSFGFEIEREGLGIVKVRYHDYEGNLAASGHWKRYLWNGLFWIPIGRSQLIVA